MMTIGSTGGTSYNQSPNFDVGVAIPPSYVADEPAVISQGPSITIFSRFSAGKRSCLGFIQIHLQHRKFGPLLNHEGYEPVRTSSYAPKNIRCILMPKALYANLFTMCANVTYTMRDSYFFSPVFVGSAVPAIKSEALFQSFY
jgi:hypothetical protein